MSDERPTIADDEIQEELTAYLDGELDVEASQQVEQRLADDVEYRQRLQQLQRAWDLLDQLPRAHASESFTHTTVEMIALAAEDDVEQSGSRTNGRRRMVWLITAAASVICAVGAYIVTTYLADADNRRLVRDLPVIENLDLYSQVDSIEFLKLLDREGLFPEDVETPDNVSQ